MCSICNAFTVFTQNRNGFFQCIKINVITAGCIYCGLSYKMSYGLTIKFVANAEYDVAPFFSLNPLLLYYFALVFSLAKLFSCETFFSGWQSFLLIFYASYSYVEKQKVDISASNTYT